MGRGALLPARGNTMRVKHTGQRSCCPPHPGQEGTLVGPGKNFIHTCGATQEEREARDKAYAETHSMIHWDGCEYAWNCRNEDFEPASPEGIL